MRSILERSAAGDSDARLALDVYLHRLRAAVAAMAASMGGIDALLFTGGVGERSPAIRAMAAGGLAFLGVAIDAGRNEADGPADREITGPGASVRTLVVVAREDLEIAHEVREVLAGRPAQVSP
jgi:acetate kinase